MHHVWREHTPFIEQIWKCRVNIGVQLGQSNIFNFVSFKGYPHTAVGCGGTLDSIP